MQGSLLSAFCPDGIRSSLVGMGATESREARVWRNERPLAGDPGQPSHPLGGRGNRTRSKLQGPLGSSSYFHEKKKAYAVRV